MIDRLTKQLNLFFGFAAIAVLFGLAAFLARLEISGFDIWLHIKAGEFIVQHGYVPAADIFSCTIQGAPWVDHEWLFQIIVYLVDLWGGPEGLLTLQSSVVVLTLLLLLLFAYQKKRQLEITIMLLLVLFVYASRFTLRPDLFSLLFFTLFLVILNRYLAKRWSLYALMGIQILWVNMHGYFFIGPLLVLIKLAAELAKRRLNLPWEWNETARLNDTEYSRLKKILGLTLLACLVNPLTFEGAWYPLGVFLKAPFKDAIFFQHIQELQRPIAWDTLFSSYRLHYKILILVSAASLFFNRRRLDLGVLLTWVIFLLFSLIAIRNLIFFALAAYGACAMNAMRLFPFDHFGIRFDKKIFQGITIVGLKIFLIFWMVTCIGKFSKNAYFDFAAYEFKSEFGGVTQNSYPAGAADFLVDNNISGNFFNDFNSGAYLINRCFPNIKVFIDGRTEVYGADFFRYYKKIWEEGDRTAFNSAVKQYRLTGVFLNSMRTQIPEKILKYLYSHRGWAMVYFDYDGVIFLKKDAPENKNVIKKFKKKLSSYNTPPLDLRRVGPRKVVPYQYIHRAYTLETLGLNEKALAEASEALKVLPYYASAYKIKGKIYGKKGDHEKAFENFRIAVLLAPQDIETRFNLALAYENLNDFTQAIRQYAVILRQAPREAKGYFRIAKACAKDKQYAKALEHLNRAHRLAPDDIKDLLVIGDLLYEQKAFLWAVKVYTIGLETGKQLAKVHNQLGLALLASGETEKAKKEFERGLSLDPNNEELKKNIRSL